MILAAEARFMASIMIRSSMILLFTGEQVGEGKKSLAFAVTFRSPSKTLSAEDSEAIRKAIVDKAEVIGAQLRA